jgi:tripartite-type tricarboxylate transporter receptor subunit TctC
MKKLLPLILASCLLLSITGCTKDSSKTETTETTVTKTETTSSTSSTTVDGEWEPTKDITWIVPYEAGGNSDIMARVYAKSLSKYSSKSINITNVSGAGGRTGAEQVKNTTPDGYTYLLQPVAYPMQKSLGLAKFTYTDFDMVTQWVGSTLAVVVNADSEYQTLDDLLNAAKANPKDIKMGSRTGTLPLFAILDLQSRADVEFNVVDLDQKAPELLSNRIDCYIDGIGSLKQYIDSGKFRCLAFITSTEVPGYEDIPTYKSLGFTDYEYLQQTFGMWAPKGTNPAAIEYMNDLAKQASEDPDLIADFENLGVVPKYLTTEEYTDYMDITYNSFNDIVKEIL